VCRVFQGRDSGQSVCLMRDPSIYYANEFVRHPEYWQNVIQASEGVDRGPIRRALTIMGRKEEEADLDASMLILPGHAGLGYPLDEPGPRPGRHGPEARAHVVPRRGTETRVEVGRRLHTPLLPALDGGGRMDLVAGKMSKSKPDSSILLNDAPTTWRERSARPSAREGNKGKSGPRDGPTCPVPSSREVDDPARPQIRWRRGLRDVRCSVESIRRRRAPSEGPQVRSHWGPESGTRPVRKYFEAHSENLSASRKSSRRGETCAPNDKAALLAAVAESC